MWAWWARRRRGKQSCILRITELYVGFGSKAQNHSPGASAPGGPVHVGVVSEAAAGLQSLLL